MYKRDNAILLMSVPCAIFSANLFDLFYDQIMINLNILSYKSGILLCNQVICTCSVIILYT